MVSIWIYHRQQHFKFKVVFTKNGDSPQKIFPYQYFFLRKLKDIMCSGKQLVEIQLRSSTDTVSASRNINTTGQSSIHWKSLYVFNYDVSVTSDVNTNKTYSRISGNKHVICTSITTTLPLPMSKSYHAALQVQTKSAAMIFPA